MNTTPPSPAAAAWVDAGVMMSPHFSVRDFTASDEAARRGLDNRLPRALLNNAHATARMLEAVRRRLSELAGKDVPMLLSSGFRSPELNRAIGSTGQAHPLAAAADWRAPAFGTPLQICEALAPRVSELGIGQLIHEYGRWVHTSWLKVTPVNRVITIDRYNHAQRTRTGVWPVEA